MKTILALLVLAAVAYVIKKKMTKKDIVNPTNNTGSSNGSGSGIGSGGSSDGIVINPNNGGSSSGSGSGSGIGSGGSSDGIKGYQGPKVGSGSGSGTGTGDKGNKGSGLLYSDGSEGPFIKDDSPSNQIKDQLK